MATSSGKISASEVLRQFREAFPEIKACWERINKEVKMTNSVNITGDNITITVDGVPVYPMEPGPTPPVEKPKLVITTQGGSANTNEPRTIEGTIDLPNRTCDILLDAGPTSFGTTRADNNGRWAKQVTFDKAGTWTLTAHATNIVGTTDSNSVVFQVSTSSSGGGGGGSTDAPPEPVTRVGAGASVSTVQTAINACPAGGSVVLPPGNYNLGGLRLKNGAVLWADGVCNVSGDVDCSSLSNWTVAGKSPGQGFVFTGRLNATSASNFVVACATFNNQSSNGYDGSAIRLSSARSGVVVNCDFNGCQGNVLGMYNLNAINIDGNHFVNCRQPISFQFATDGSNGNDMTVQRCTFEGCTRAAMEMGPSSTSRQVMNKLKVNNNWFDRFNNAGGGDAWAMLPISLVAQGAQNTEVKNNYISRGPVNVKIDAPAIEFTGTGECTGNVNDGFTWDGFTYQSGWFVHNNSGYLNPWGWANNGSGSGTFANNTNLSSKPPVAPKPTRIAQSQYYSW